MFAFLKKLAAPLLIASVAACALAEPADDAASGNLPPKGSMARQLRLVAQLKAVNENTTLTAALDHNRQQWESLSPDQRSKFRQDAVAFLNQDPQKQEQLLKQYEKLILLSAQQQEKYRQMAQWLKVVTESFTPQERKELLEMNPDERAHKLLERKAELTRQGKLPADQPASVPASRSSE